MNAFEILGEAAKSAGPLNSKTAALVKLGLSLGSGLEGSTHSSTRKALAAGGTPAEVRHAALLGTTTLGFPAMMRGRSWVEDVLKSKASCLHITIEMAVPSFRFKIPV